MLVCNPISTQQQRILLLTELASNKEKCVIIANFFTESHMFWFSGPLIQWYKYSVLIKSIYTEAKNIAVQLYDPHYDHISGIH